MDDFAGKPLRTGELAKKCQQWMSRRPAESSNRTDEAATPAKSDDSDQLADVTTGAHGTNSG